ncbi:hypothetical protein ACV2BR_22570, partial [Salmonella enterica subsp. enterica serovar Heidelberg]
ADRNRSHWSTSKTPSYTKSVSWQHHRDKDNLTVNFTTQYENIDTKVEIKVTLRQELIESVSRFDFDVYQQFLERKKEFKEKPVRVPFSKRL